MARLSSGCAGSLSSSLSIFTNFGPLSVVSRFGLNVGYDARARIAPVLGSMATAAAWCPPSASSALYAAFCAFGLIVR